MLEAIVLAGGLGTRLKPVVSNLPKPMAPVAGRPFLEILLSSLSCNGFNRVVVSVGYMADKIIEYFGNEYHGLEIVYSTESQPLGTGGAIRLAMTKTVSDHVFIFNGDTYVEIDVEEANKRWLESSRHVIVGAIVEDTVRYGRMLISGEKVTGFQEKGISGRGLINAGCYILGAGTLDYIPVGDKFSFEEVFLKSAIEDGKVDAFITEGLFIDIGVPDDYKKAQKIFSTK